MRLSLPDPMVAAPFKVAPNAEPTQKAWLRRHAWPVRVAPMTDGHASFWDDRVRPTIQRIEFERHAGLRPHESPRADAYWPLSWGSIRRVFSAPAALLPVRAPGRVPKLTTPHLYAVEVQDSGRVARPVGMILGLSHYPFSPQVQTAASSGTPRPEQATVFTWLITAAPTETLEAMEVPPNIAIGKVLLDVTVQISLAARHLGHVLLHADPRGGDVLLHFYRNCMMLQVPLREFPYISSSRRNDGRYFYFDESRAGAFSMLLGHLRGSRLGVHDGAFAPIELPA